jgi:hypothetical protein
VVSILLKCNLWVRCYFRTFMLDEWEVHSYAIIPSLRSHTWSFIHYCRSLWGVVIQMQPSTKLHSMGCLHPLDFGRFHFKAFYSFKHRTFIERSFNSFVREPNSNHQYLTIIDRIESQLQLFLSRAFCTVGYHIFHHGTHNLLCSCRVNVWNIL